MGRRIKNRVGFRHAKILVIEQVSVDRRPSDDNLWKCQCDCGNTLILDGARLNPSRCPDSCGCSSYEKPRRTRVPHLASANDQYRHHVGAAKQHGSSALPRTIWEQIAFQPCYYCGEIDERPMVPSRVARYKSMSPELFDKYKIKINGIDRVDPQKGYEPSNCVACCWTCNHMKARYTVEEFLQRIKRVYEHQNLGSIQRKPVCYRHIQKQVKEICLDSPK